MGRLSPVFTTFLTVVSGSKWSNRFALGMLWPEVMVQLNPAFKPGEIPMNSSRKVSFIPMFVERFRLQMERLGPFTSTKTVPSKVFSEEEISL